MSELGDVMSGAEFRCFLNYCCAHSMLSSTAIDTKKYKYDVAELIHSSHNGDRKDYLLAWFIFYCIKTFDKEPCC